MNVASIRGQTYVKRLSRRCVMTKRLIMCMGDKMSYDCYLNDAVTGETLTTTTEHFIRGGTCCSGGCKDLWLNITFNYAPIVYNVMPCGIKGLNGKLAADTIPLLEQAIEKLGDDVVDDYWTATEGNVKRALYGLLALAKMRPDGVWYISY